MEHFKMLWGDVERMAGDFCFPVNSVDHLEFTPAKKEYEKRGSASLLYRSFINSFKAASKTFTVRKWVLDEVGELPSYISNTKQNTSRWNVEFIKTKENKGEKIWQQL